MPEIWLSTYLDGNSLQNFFAAEETWTFRNLNEVRELSWAWMLDYNEERDHDGLGGLTPAEMYNTVRHSTFKLSA